jgi:hypothetical protein
LFEHDLFRKTGVHPASSAGQAFSGSCSGPGRLRDDAGVPLICPTCQIAFQSIHAGDCLLLCMGLFSIFLVGSRNRVGLADDLKKNHHI